MSGRKLEVHEHRYVSRVGGITHSHEGGDQRHQHDGLGPAAYTIDKDAWFAATGLRGGGRKKFTSSPSGEHLPVRELADWQRSFDITVVGEPHATVTGPGLALPNRMILGHKMRVGNVAVHRRGPTEGPRPKMAAEQRHAGAGADPAQRALPFLDPEDQ